MATKWKNTEIWKEIAVMAGFLLAMVLLFGLLLAAIFWKSSSCPRKSISFPAIRRNTFNSTR